MVRPFGAMQIAKHCEGDDENDNEDDGEDTDRKDVTRIDEELEHGRGFDGVNGFRLHGSIFHGIVLQCCRNVLIMIYDNINTFQGRQQIVLGRQFSVERQTP